MNRHIRSGTWTLAELYDAAYLLDKTSTLTLEGYKNVTYVKTVATLYLKLIFFLLIIFANSSPSFIKLCYLLLNYKLQFSTY